MFTSRSGSQGNSQAVPPQSIEAVRRRARHRLIGAAVLVILGVVGFPLLFDTQPRPIPVDIPIVIPAKNAQSSLAAPKAGRKPATSETPAAVAEKPVSSESVAASESLSAREEVVEAAPAKKDAAPAPKPPESKSEPKAVAKAEPVAKPAVSPAKPDVTDADRARALLEGKAAEKTAGKPDAAAQRIVVQVGAFADVARAREARQKLERAGLKTYTHVADTPDGKRIRVRVGPYATKAEADKAAARVKALGLPAAILTL